MAVKKIYTITTNGVSNGNPIAQPFTIEVNQMNYYGDEDSDHLGITTCTKNGTGNICENDDLAAQGFRSGVKAYEPSPATSTTKNTDLVNTIEIDLEAAYPGEWS